MSLITSTVASMLQEEREKDKRKLNLIVHGVPESASDISLERKEHDTELVTTIFNQRLECIDDILRLRKKDSGKQQ